jgi:thiamine biosynthesis lipoprotein
MAGQAQGSTYQVIYYAADSLVTKKQIDSILDRIDSSVSLYKPYSLINRFNESASGIPVDDHFLFLIKKSISAFQETNGSFDITVQPLVQAWGFGVEKNNSLPDSSTIRFLKSCTGTNLLHVVEQKIFKKKSCVKIDLNGIAQGYSVDVIAEFIEKNGIHNYIVELGGEIRLKGRKLPGNEQMKIGIESPDPDELEMGTVKKIITVDNGAITTSGTYRRSHETEGKRITHLIDPKTGYPVNNDLLSVTVYAKDAVTADAIDNALMVMGLQSAMEYINDNSELAAYFIYRSGNGLIKDTMSKAFQKLLKN